jgi:P27 family predicted phage terminase small subunit
MGQRGPAPKPTSLKILSGSRPRNSHEPRPGLLAELPPAPDWLDDVAVYRWNEDGPLLISLGLLTPLDLVSFAAYCQATADLVAAKIQISEEGATTVTDKGNVIQHPAVGMRNRAYEIMRKFASDFGMSPSSRASLKVEKPAEQSVMARKRS